MPAWFPISSAASSPIQQRLPTMPFTAAPSAISPTYRRHVPLPFAAYTLPVPLFCPSAFYLYLPTWSLPLWTSRAPHCTCSFLHCYHAAPGCWLMRSTPHCTCPTPRPAGGRRMGAGAARRCVRLSLLHAVACILPAPRCLPAATALLLPYHYCRLRAANARHFAARQARLAAPLPRSPHCCGERRRRYRAERWFWWKTIITVFLNGVRANVSCSGPYRQYGPKDGGSSFHFS